MDHPQKMHIGKKENPKNNSGAHEFFFRPFSAVVMKMSLSLEKENRFCK